MATLNAQVLDFFDWWLDELRGVWTRLTPRRKQSSTADWIVSLADDGIRVREVNAPEFQSIPLALTASSDEILVLLQGGARRRRPSFDIAIQPGLFLTRHLAVRRLPVRQARDMAELDLLAATPIDPAQVHVVFATAAEEDSAYHVVKAKTLAAVLDAVRRAGGSVRCLSLSRPAATLRADPLSLAAIWPPTARDAIRGREQQSINAAGRAQSQGGTSGNAINGVSENNPKKGDYREAAEREFGK